MRFFIIWVGVLALRLFIYFKSSEAMSYDFDNWRQRLGGFGLIQICFEMSIANEIWFLFPQPPEVRYDPKAKEPWLTPHFFFFLVFVTVTSAAWSYALCWIFKLR